jgi:hypothetical protein
MGKNQSREEEAVKRWFGVPSDLRVPARLGQTPQSAL